MLPNFNDEVWKDLPGYEGFYRISNYGRIKSLYGKSPKLIKFGFNQKRYYVAPLTKDGRQKKFLVHRLVALNFLHPPASDDMEVNHDDGNKLNNYYKNLNWCTHAENMDHAVRTGLKNHKGGNHFSAKKIIDTSNGKIYDSGTEAALAFGLHKNTIYAYLNGDRRNKTSLSYLN